MLCLPLAKGSVRKGEVLAPWQWRDMHQLPYTAERTLDQVLRELPQARRIMEVLSPNIKVVLVLPLGTVQALRNYLFVLPQPHQGMEKRDVLSPENSGWRAHVQEFRVHQLPHQRVFLGIMHQVPRRGRTG